MRVCDAYPNDACEGPLHHGVMVKDADNVALQVSDMCQHHWDELVRWARWGMGFEENQVRRRDY